MNKEPFNIDDILIIKGLPNMDKPVLSLTDEKTLTSVALAPSVTNYRSVVAFNFNKVNNLHLWDERIYAFYNKLIKYPIHESFIGMRVNVNEEDHFMIKLHVKIVVIEEINKLYELIKNDILLFSFYYEYAEIAYCQAAYEDISILINGIKMFISPNSFTQANHQMGNVLYQTLADIIIPNNKLIVYGRNSFHIASQLNNKFKEILCINPCPISYCDGLKALRFHKFNWSTVKTKDNLVNYINGASKDTTIIISPGRNGYSKFNEINISKLKEKKQFLYITCNEESFRKDINNNFNIKKNIMVELFPGTEFNEHIVELT